MTKKVIVISALKLLLWSFPVAANIPVIGEEIAEIKQVLPCLESSRDCVEQLTEAAIANSPELVILDQKISLIDQRLELVGERVDYSQDRQWTNYITADPVKLLQNIFGGGDVQRDRIAIADLEIKSADLEAAKAELEFRKGNIQNHLEQEILELLLTYEAASRKVSLIEAQLETFSLSYQTYRIRYRFGNGSTSGLLALEDKGEKLKTQLTDKLIGQEQSIRELLRLTGYEMEEVEQ